MAITLSTDEQILCYFYPYDHGSQNDRAFWVYGKYVKQTATTGYIQIRVRFYSHTAVWDGTASINVNSLGSTSFGYSNGSWATYGHTIPYTYDSSGKCSGTLSIKMSAGNAKWGSQNNPETFQGALLEPTTVSVSYSLPDIDPVPSAEISSITALSGTFGNNNLWIGGKTVVRITCTFSYMLNATLKMTAGGVTTNLTTFTDNKAIGSVKTFDLILPNIESLDGTTFPVLFEITASNNTGSVSDSETVNPYKYQSPIYDSSRTIKYRCDRNGNQLSQGEYGYLKLYWKISAITGNALQEGSVKINGTTLTASNCVLFSQNIANGYFEYIFALPVNTQGDITTYLRDSISDNTQTSMAIPKGIMPLSLYQSGSSVGVTVGRIATEPGLKVYLPFYLLGDDGYTVYHVHVDSNGNLCVDSA